jgi:hypothetical protein
MTRCSNQTRKGKATKKVQSRANKGRAAHAFRKVLSPVDEDEELSTEKSAKQDENRRPTRHAARNVSYNEEADSDTEPESSGDEHKDKLAVLKKVTKMRKPTSPKKKAGSKRPTPIATDPSVVKSSPLSIGLSPAKITLNMWKSNASDWRVPDAIDY